MGPGGHGPEGGRHYLGRGEQYERRGARDARPPRAGPPPTPPRERRQQDRERYAQDDKAYPLLGERPGLAEVEAPPPYR